MTNVVSEDKTKPLDILINDSLNTIMGFRLVIEEETDALLHHEYRKAAELQEQKEKYSERYGDTIEQLSVHSEELKKLPESMKQRFREENALFSAAVDENKTAIMKAGAITSRLSSRIISIAKKALTKDGLNYTRYGTAKQSHIKPLHMQINETL